MGKVDVVYELELLIREKRINENKKTGEGKYAYKSGGFFTKTRLIRDLFDWLSKHALLDHRVARRQREVEKDNISFM